MDEDIHAVAREAFLQLYGAPMPEVARPAPSPVKLDRPTLTDEQAAAFQAFMIATGANGKTVGNGRVRPI